MFVRKYSYYLASIWKLLTGITPWQLVLRVFLRLPTPAFPLIELRGSGVRFKTRGAMDIWSVKEAFLDRFYERFGTPVGKGWTVIDIGGGIGEFAILAALRSPENRVFAFEPTPGSYSLLQENLRLNSIENVQAYQEAIWSKSSNLMINTSAGEPLQYGSLSLERSSSLQIDHLIVKSTTLSEAFSRSGIIRCDLLKIDCEGAEYEILFNTPNELLARIDRIVMEYHDGVTAHRHEHLAAFLKDKGFEVEIFPNFVHQELGYLRALRRTPLENGSAIIF